MAIARAPQGGGGASNALLIVFVAVAVVSLGITVFLFTQQEDLRNQVTRAESDRERENQRARDAQQALNNMARQILGKEGDPAELTEEVAAAREAVVRSERLRGAGIPDEAAVIPAFGTLADAYGNLQTRIGQLQQERDDLEAALKDLSEQIAERKEAYDANAAELARKVEALEQQFVNARDNWQEKIAQLEATLRSQSNEADQQLSEERQLRQQLEDQLARERERNEALQGELAAFKPRPDPFAPLQRADGTVVRAMPGDDIVYIDLGRGDGVSRGMTFSVHPRLEGISADGKGKATLEIVQVFDNTSECKVTSTTSSKPVIRGDLIANPVFDRTRQYRFVVAGGFDLDFDGKIDDPSGEKVAAMIHGWGGIVTGEVDTSTDFLVAGVPVTRVPQPVGAEPEAVEVRQAEAEARREAFESKLRDARGLSIPILTRTQFLHFVGRPVPDGTPDDSLPRLR